MATHDEQHDDDKADTATSPRIRSAEEADRVTVRGSVVGRVQARKALITSSGAGAVVAGDDATLSAGVAGALVAGGDMVVTAGGGAVLVAGGEVDATNSNSGVLVTRRANIEKGFVGVLVAQQADLGDSRVLMTTPQAIAMGAALGVVTPAVAYLLHQLSRRQKERAALQPPRSAWANLGLRLLRFLLGVGVAGGVAAGAGYWLRQRLLPGRKGRPLRSSRR